jgi:hypothetical protein
MSGTASSVAPFRLAEAFVLRTLSIARCGVVILARFVFREPCLRQLEKEDDASLAS